MTSEDFDHLICKHGLESIIGPITESMLPAVRFETTRCPDKDLPIGTTKFGGLPDLPHDLDWPAANNIPLTFLAQIRLDDLPHAHLDCNEIPTTGLLHFWYDASDPEADHATGYDDDGEHVFRVTRTDLDPASLTRSTFPPQPRNYPDSEFCREFYPFHPCKASVHLAQTISPAIYHSPEPQQEVNADRVWDLMCDLHGDPGKGLHRLLGHPDQIQSNMQIDLYLEEEGIRPQTSTAEDWLAVQRHYLGRGKEWLLLMQIDTDQAGPGWMWGDVGMLYFWIKREDLAAHNFSAVRGFMQAC